MTVRATETPLRSFDLGMIRLRQTVNRLGNVQLQPKVDLDDHRARETRKPRTLVLGGIGA